MNKDFCYPDGKRYYTFDSFLKQKFGCKIAKISLNGGFTCPNRDGTKGVGGCIYCSDKLSGDFAGDPKNEHRRTARLWKKADKRQVEACQIYAVFSSRDGYIRAG